VLLQVPHLAENLERDKHLLPTGRLDADLQQVDLRATNTWRMTLAEVPTAELLEVQLCSGRSETDPLGRRETDPPALCEPPADPGWRRRSRATPRGGGAGPLQRSSRSEAGVIGSAERSEGSVDA
jgi:hypothetical protein